MIYVVFAAALIALVFLNASTACVVVAALVLCSIGIILNEADHAPTID